MSEEIPQVIKKILKQHGDWYSKQCIQVVFIDKGYRGYVENQKASKSPTIFF